MSEIFLKYRCSGPTGRRVSHYAWRKFSGTNDCVVLGKGNRLGPSKVKD